MIFSWRRRRREEDLEAEIQAHLEMAMRDRTERGESPEEAGYAVRREFGNVGLVKEVTRDMWGWTWLDRLRQDLLFGARVLRRSPGFTTLAVVMLGVAMGIGAIMFSIINCVLLLPLPYKDSDRLVRIHSTDWDESRMIAADYINSVWQSRSFDALAAVRADWTPALTDKEYPEGIFAMHVSAGFFNILGARAALGRLFQDSDFDSSKKYDYENVYENTVVVLSYGLWQRRYAGDPTVIGRTSMVNGKPVTVIGVTAPDFQFAASIQDPVVDCWFPRVFREGFPFEVLTVIGRLREHTTLRQSQADLDVIAGRVQQSRPKANSNRGLRVVALHESIVGNVRRQLMMLFGAVVLVLLTACANIANLLLARAAGRQREMAARSAVGASRLRLIRQVLTESVLLCVLGGFTAILLVMLCQKVIVALAPRDLPRVGEIAFDIRTFGFTFAVALVTGVLSGVIPALRASRTSLTEALKDGGPASVTRGRGWIGGGLVTAQIALALMLLIASGLMIRSYVQLHAVPLGFDASNILVLNAHPSTSLERSWPRRAAMALRIQYSESLLEQLQAVPGVDCAAIGALPIRGAAAGFGFHLEGQQEPIRVASVSTTPDYFHVIGVQLLSGRFFSAGDKSDTTLVAVVNRSAAQKLWPGANPIGKKLYTERSKPITIEVVGLVADVRMSGLEGPPVPFVYIPMSQSLGVFPGTLLIRTKVDPLSLVPSLRKALQALDRQAPLESPLGKIQTVEEILASQFVGRRFNLMLISIFGALAFVLASIGIYGTIAFSISKRTHEIGIRMALGAGRGSVLRLVLSQGLWMLMIGEMIGLAGALVFNKLMATMVFGIATTDRPTYIGITLAWAAMALLAGYLPARKAVAIDPVRSLRCE